MSDLEQGVGEAAGAFRLRPGTASFSSSRPGNYASMFVEGRRLQFRGDLSVLDDARRSYTWVFDLLVKVSSGAVFVFATADREVVGAYSAKSGEVSLACRQVCVTRTAAGEPVAVDAGACEVTE